MKKRHLIFTVFFALTLIVANVSGQNTGGDDLAAKTQNPVGAMYSQNPGP